MGPEESVCLEALASAWAISVSLETSEKILGFCRLLVRWNERINLTGARSVKAILRDHLPDAFALAAQIRDSRSVLDVGSGGGLPALPLALLRPTCSVVLVEPRARKAAFLRTAIRELRIENASVLQAHARKGSPLLPLPFDAAVSRATFPVEDWLSLAVDLVGPGGQVLALATSKSVPFVPGSLVPCEERSYVLDNGKMRWILGFRRKDVSRGT